MKPNDISREATELQNEQTLYSTVPPQYPSRDADCGEQPTVPPTAQGAQTSLPTANNTARQSSNTASMGGSKAKAGKASVVKRIAVGAGAGLVLGGIGAAVMSMRSDDQPVEVDEDGTPVDNEVGEVTPEVLQDAGVYDGQVAMAGSVSDDMSFAEAFSAARQEVGPGGVFQWHGQIYGTYTAEEWNNLSPDQQQEYADHFNWDRIEQPSTDNGQPTQDQPQVVQSDGELDSGENPGPQVEVEEEQQPVIDDDINVQTNDDEIQPQTQEEDGPRPFTISEDSEVEVLGVVHDEDTNQNIATISVDGQQAILVDVDGDMEFDYIQADFDGDGQVASNEYGEYYDGQGPTVDGLGGFTDGYDPSTDPSTDTPIDDDIPVITNDDDITDDPIDNSDQIYDDI